jgi:hypothetical protein
VRNTVEAVLEAEPVPVHSRGDVTVVGHVDDELRALLHTERRSGDRSVVGEHPHGRIADAVGDRRDPQVELVAAVEDDALGRLRHRKPRRLSGELSRSRIDLMVPHTVHEISQGKGRPRAVSAMPSMVPSPDSAAVESNIVESSRETGPPTARIWAVSDRRC